MWKVCVLIMSIGIIVGMAFYLLRKSVSTKTELIEGGEDATHGIIRVSGFYQEHSVDLLVLPKRNRSNLYEYPGGMRNKGQSALDASLRELYEETGINIQKSNNILQCEKQTPGSSRHKPRVIAGFLVTGVDFSKYSAFNSRISPSNSRFKSTPYELHDIYENSNLVKQINGFFKISRDKKSILFNVKANTKLILKPETCFN